MKGDDKMKDLSGKLAKAVERFESNYKNTLNASDLDSKTSSTLYDLGADIKHLFDDVINILDEN